MRDPSSNGQIRIQLSARRDRLKQTIAGSPSGEELVDLLKEVEAALERIDAGSYGVCELCNGDIEEDYLRSDPLARICLSHLSDEQQRAVERDLELAHRIQGGLLPPSSVTIAGWDLHYRYEPAGPVSGDYCDILQPSPEEVMFLCGDVSGKGVAASLLMSNLHAIFRSLDTTGIPLGDLVARANRVFGESTLSSHFATLVCGRAGPSGEVELCNAGHCPVLLATHDRVDRLHSNGLPLGVFLRSEYPSIRLQLQKGDTLLFYTDGLTESRSGENEEFGEDRLATALRKQHALALPALVGTLLDEARSFRNGNPKQDDLTVVAIRRTI